MKNLFKILGIISLGIVVISCNSGASIYASTGRVYRPTRVVVVKQNNLPPGQAKKIYGDKSAKYYALGHNKYKKYRH